MRKQQVTSKTLHSKTLPTCTQKYFLDANAVYGSKGVLCIFLLHSLLTFHYLTWCLSSNFIDGLFVL